MSQQPLARLVHGSQDSSDLDVLYVMDSKPSFLDCQRFCADKEENRNIIVVRDGVVVECFKGLPDEVNNALLRTYGLHAQTSPNPVLRAVQRVVPLKLARGVRVILTRLTRTSYRAPVKAALRTCDFDEQRRALSQIDFRLAALSVDALKSVAFQFGQLHGLIRGQEHYSKSEIAEAFPELEPILYRRAKGSESFDVLNSHRDMLMEATRPVSVARRGALNLLTVSGVGLADAEPWLVQCRGALFDLRAERVVAWAPSFLEADALHYVERGDAPRFVGLSRWEPPQARDLARWSEGVDFSLLEPEVHQHFFLALTGEGRGELVAMRHRHTGDVVHRDEVRALNRRLQGEA